MASLLTYFESFFSLFFINDHDVIQIQLRVALQENTIITAMCAKLSANMEEYYSTNSLINCMSLVTVRCGRDRVGMYMCRLNLLFAYYIKAARVREKLSVLQS